MRQGLGGGRKRTDLGRLIIFYDATQCSFGCAQGTVQHVDIDLSSLVFGFQPAADLKPPALCWVIRGTRE